MCKELEHHPEERFLFCHPEEADADVRISSLAVRPRAFNKAAIQSLCGDCTAPKEILRLSAQNDVLAFSTILLNRTIFY